MASEGCFSSALQQKKQEQQETKETVKISRQGSFG
jgi:hypothetical protein